MSGRPPLWHRAGRAATIRRDWAETMDMIRRTLISALCAVCAVVMATGPACAADTPIPKPDTVTLLDLGSECIPCELQDRIVRRVTPEFGDKVAVVYLDVEKNPQYKEQYRVEIIPTLVFYDRNGQEVQRVSGYMKEGAMRKLLRELTGVETR